MAKFQRTGHGVAAIFIVVVTLAQFTIESSTAFAAPEANGASQVVFRIDRQQPRSNVWQVSQDHALRVVETLATKDAVYVAEWSDWRSADDVVGRLQGDWRILYAYIPTDVSFVAAPFGLPGWGTNGYWQTDGIGLEDSDVEASVASTPTVQRASVDANPLRISLDAFGTASPWTTESDADVVRRAHDLTRGAGAVVAVLDTGVASKHPILKGSVATRSRQFDFVSNDNDADEVYPGGTAAVDSLEGHLAGHGTFVAGLVHVVAPEAEILPVRVLDPYGIGDPARIAEAIDFAVAADVDAIVLSLASLSPATEITAAIERAAAADVLVIAPAGNVDGASVAKPAASSCAFAVAAATASGQPATFASGGPEVDISAPGDRLVSTLPDPMNLGDETFGIWSGSSFAAPLVAGQAALLRSLKSELTARELAALIVQTATPMDLDASDVGRFGAGMPHVTRSLYRLVDGGVVDVDDSPIADDC